MNCLECVKEGKKSVVKVGTLTINAGPMPTVGSYTDYICTNGHKWREEIKE
jgi:hypothetical protein